MLFTMDDLMFLASQLQIKNKIQSFKLVKPTPEHAEIQCSKCDAKAIFTMKNCGDDDSTRFRMSSQSVLEHDKDFHNEIK